MFPIELWNADDRTIMNFPRSNNSIEGWHNAFAKRVAIVHPSVTKLVEKIRREQSKFGRDKNQNQRRCNTKSLTKGSNDSSMINPTSNLASI